MTDINDIHFQEPASGVHWTWSDLVNDETLTKERLRVLGVSEDFLRDDAGMTYSSQMLREFDDYMRMKKAYTKAAPKIVHDVFFPRAIWLMRKLMAPRINEHKRAAKAMKVKRARTGRRRK